ncbi:MAG: hypothetical protein IT426_05665 [Pirellulales bacterium]|nr:hypothetical protein [Pirellulales bacterium]
MKKCLPAGLWMMLALLSPAARCAEEDAPVWRTVPPIRAAKGETAPAAMKEHIELLKSRLPGENFTIVEARPFVVVGDDEPAEVRRRAEQNVRWAVKLLKKAYFTKDPPVIIDIWLFKDKESYEANAQELFGKKPDTPFGYYSAAHRALVMNISTGGGTLIHELVHPYIAANFPDCPSWFNEGLASLYEQCGEEDGEIHGYTNWRLAGLQRAVAGKKVPSFKTLCATTTEEFYSQDKGTNYAQARYLCYYLQQEGLLKSYYKKFRANSAKDPAGYQTLQEILGRKGDAEMKAFQKEWEQWVLKLKFRD